MMYSAIRGDLSVSIVCSVLSGTIGIGGQTVRFPGTTWD